MLDPNQYRNDVAQTEQQLKRQFLEFTRLTSPKKRSLAASLTDQEGTVDAEVEGLTTTQNQRDLSIKFHWGHNHNFGDGFSVSGRMGDRHLNLMAQFLTRYQLETTYFQDKDIIDVGCWTGGTTLLLKMLGARHILALEEVQKYARTARNLVTNVYDLEHVTCDGTNLYDLSVRDSYDIVYCPGVVYHLSDPVLALRRLFNALRDGGDILVESMGVDDERSVCEFVGNRTFHETEGESSKSINRGGWNWFCPSPLCLKNWMNEAGFTGVDAFYSPVSKRVFAIGRRKAHVEITRAGLSDRSVP